MKKVLCRIALIFLVCLSQSVIAQGYCSIHDDDCIHYSERQDIRCLECLMNEPYKDSIIIVKDSIISTQHKFIESTDKVIVDLDLQLVKSRTDLIIMKEKRKRAYIFGGATTLGAFLLTFFMML